MSSKLVRGFALHVREKKIVDQLLLAGSPEMFSLEGYLISRNLTGKKRTNSKRADADSENLLQNSTFLLFILFTISF